MAVEAGVARVVVPAGGDRVSFRFRGTLVECAAAFFGGRGLDRNLDMLLVKVELERMSATERDDLARMLEGEGYEVTDRRAVS